MAINGRRKGNKAQRVAASIISSWVGKKFASTPASGGLHWQRSNVQGDIVITVDNHYFPFSVEVKSYNKIDFSHLLNPKIKNCDILTFWEQCLTDANRVKGNKKVPLLMMRYNSLPSEFFFVALPYNIWKIIPNEEKLKVQKMFTFKDRLGEHFVMLQSTEFFKVSYKVIRKPIKQYLKNVNK